MQIIERDVLVDPNETGDYWYIPVTFYDATGVKMNSLLSSYLDIYAWTVDTANAGSAITVQTTNWAYPSDGSIYALKIPKSTSFTQYIHVWIEVWDSDDDNANIVALPLSLYIRKAPVGGGSGGGSGSSSSISVPTAPEIAAAVWNYGAEEGDETIEDRTLSTTVDVNPSAIAQAVWNYDDANPASGTLGTRTLTTAIPTASSIATEVLTTDVSAKTVGENGYTIKHLIMASQRSIVVTEGNETKWKIMSNQTDAETGEEIVIATRTLTLNGNGAITQTE